MKQNPHLPGTPDEFIENNMKLANKVAWGFIKAANEYIQFDKDDFLSIAYIGLIKAYQKFDPTRYSGIDGGSVKFSTYAVPMIRGAIMRQMRDRAYMIRTRNGPHILVDSLDRPLDEGGKRTVLDLYNVKTFDNHDRLYLDDFAAQLKPKLKMIYDMRIGQKLTQKDIGEKLGYSQIWVSRLEAQIFKKAEEYGQGMALEKAG